MAQTIVHKAAERGGADHGWLKTKHSFSFANYYNPENIHFGALRVLNDDIIAGGMGFGTHPHDNMEIITIPLKGDLAHKDSMGNASVIRHGEIQVMSAGTGITHSEFNANKDIPAEIFQIWIFPNKKNVAPRYDQIKIDINKMHNHFLQLVSPYPDDEGVWIHQDAWIFMARFDKDFEQEYHLKNKSNGVYAFVIDGSFTINGTVLDSRDAIGLWDAESFTIRANTDQADILLIEVPMNFEY